MLPRISRAGCGCFPAPDAIAKTRQIGTALVWWKKIHPGHLFAESAFVKTLLDGLQDSLCFRVQIHGSKTTLAKQSLASGSQRSKSGSKPIAVAALASAKSRSIPSAR